MLGQPAPLERFASRRPQVLAVRTVCDLCHGGPSPRGSSRRSGAPDAVRSLAECLFPPARGYRRVPRAGSSPSRFPARVVHQTGVMEAAEGCEIRRSDFLPAISSPGRQPQSRASSGRSNERQSCPHPHPVPQSGLQQRSRGQLLRRTGREGMASGPRRPPVGEARLGRELRSGRGLAQGSGSYLGLPTCWPKLSVCSRMDV
ncbi:methylated-DNA--protein-cysteine methyltransferase isoform X3 [Pan paniscus]|uniref:methylated-DNA--protein-cysteine methyltransferase isoform X3 n=1 Tax=Pan paniscus TaxID=9597 RepID=UPI003003BC65